MKKSLIVAAGVVVSFGFAPLMATAATLSLSPANASATQGQNFTVNVALNLWLIPLWGFRGTAVASVVSEVVIVVCAAVLLRRYLKYGVQLMSMAKITISAVVMGGVVWWLRDPLYGVIENLNVLVLIGVGGVVYAGMLWATGVVGPDKLALIRGSAK